MEGLLRRRVCYRRQSRPRTVDGQQAWSARYENLLRIGLRIKHEADEAVAHLIPVLQPPADLLGRIRIELVIGRIVEMRDAHETRALRQSIGSVQM